MQSSRFGCPSCALSPKALLRRTRRAWAVGLALALGVHWLAAQLRGLAPQQQVAKPLTTQFVKRQPRLTKPLELKKRPVPRQRRIQRKMVSVRARQTLGKGTAGVQPARALRGLARPRVDVARRMAPDRVLAEPGALAAIVEGSREPASKVDMSLEMMDIQALDTGRYHAMVIQDPADKKNLRGFFRLRFAYSPSTGTTPKGQELENRMVIGVIAVVEAVNQYTNVKTTFQGRVPFGSQELLKTPWVFSMVGKVELPAGERMSLGRYLTSGGFHFIDCPEPNPDIIHAYPASNILSGKRLVQDALETQGLIRGKDWIFEKLPHTHPIFHCYFDFAGPPPCFYDKIYSNRGEIDGAYVNGRWPVIVSQKAFLHFWNDPNWPELRSERMVQFGVNTIVFALTQEGSITRRVMDEVH